MSDQCGRWRVLLGSHALGLLDEAEAVGVRAHLDGCPSCRAELDQLRSTAAALAVADVSHVADPPPRPRPGLGADISAEISAVLATRRRRRLLPIAAAAIVLGLVSSVVALQESGGGDPPTVLEASQPGVRAEVELVAKPWGTEIHLEASGLDPGQGHGVWLERADGSRVPAGTFVAVAGRTVKVVLAGGVPRAEAVAVGLTRLADETVVARASL
jgi:hypothetical protein